MDKQETLVDGSLDKPTPSELLPAEVKGLL